MIFKVDSSTCRPDEEVFLDEEFGDIYSPGYEEGKNYPNDFYCEYVIRSQEGYSTKLTFIVVDLECRDTVRVVDVAKEIKTIFEFSGNETMPPLLLNTNMVVLKFRTDFIGTRRGFHIQYLTSNSIKSLCEEGENPCRNRNCFSEKNRCDGIDDCGDGTDEEKCDFPLPITECGKREVSETFGLDRIIGGREAVPHSWPWQAALHSSTSFPCSQICGGTLINAQWVLSASHCIGGDTSPDVWKVHLGKHHAFKIDKTEQIRYVERIIIPPDITGEKLLNSSDVTNMENDYALLKLNAPVKFTKEVRPACLPKQGFELSPGKKCWTAGWGTTKGTGADHALKELEYVVQDIKTCKIPNLPTMICTKNEKGFQDSCHGDSGGPFVCEFDGKWYVNGIVSFGTFGTEQGGLCAMPENNAVFAKVSNKVNWILEQINKYS